MHLPTCQLAVVVAATVGVLSLSACGGDSPPGTVAQVGSYTITRQTLQHWANIEAVLNNEEMAQQPVPPGVIPDPPGYTACIRHQEQLAPSAVKQTAQLKKQCREHNEQLQRQVLVILLTFDWLDQEAAKQHVTITNSELHSRLASFVHAIFPSNAAFRLFLTHTGLTLPEELLRLKSDILAVRLRERALSHAGPGLKEQEVAFGEYELGFAKRWAARTDCRPGYVIPDCKQYKGSESPAGSL